MLVIGQHSRVQNRVTPVFRFVCHAITRDGQKVFPTLPNLKTFARNLSRIFRDDLKLLYKVNRRASEFGKEGNLTANCSGSLNNSRHELPAIGLRVFPVQSEKILGLL